MLVQLLPETTLVATALVMLGCAVAAEKKSGRDFSPGVGIAIAAGGIVIAMLLMAFVPSPTNSSTPLLAADPLARSAKALLLGFGLLAVLLPPARGEMRNHGEYLALMLFALTGLLLAVGSNHLLFLFVSLELAGLSLYLLAGFPRTPRASEASLKYFLFGGVSAAFMLYGISLVFGASHTLALGEIPGALESGGRSALAMTGLAMLLAGLGFKLAAAPFHYWAPDVYQGAPATTVGLVAAASKLAGAVVAIRILMIGFPHLAGSAAWGGITAGWTVWLAMIAAVSMLLGNFLALAQTSVRRLLAWSAVANAGYLLTAIAANGPKSATAAVFYIVVYGLATFGALAVTAAVERERGNDSISSFAGLLSRSRLQAIALLVFMASLAGIPPLAGFFGKFALFTHAVAGSSETPNTGLIWLVGLGAMLSALSLYYYLRVLKHAFVTNSPVADEPEALPLSHKVCIAIPAAGLICLGLFPDILLHPLATAVRDTLASTLR